MESKATAFWESLEIMRADISLILGAETICGYII